MNYKEHIRQVADFPKKGILFYDITTLMEKPSIFNNLINDMLNLIKQEKPTKIAGIESRGFIFGSILASKLNLPFVLIRKKGKLPYKTISESYELEYGNSMIEIHEDSLKKDDRVIIVDDLLATGGTAKASANLVEKVGAKVESFIFAIELDFLKGKELIKNYKINTIIKY
jgi:adenine phosphoribosyltransferase